MLLVSVCAAVQQGEEQKCQGEGIKRRQAIKAYQNGSGWKGVKEIVTQRFGFEVVHGPIETVVFLINFWKLSLFLEVQTRMLSPETLLSH